jgi:hypothetical protein
VAVGLVLMVAIMVTVAILAGSKFLKQIAHALIVILQSNITIGDFWQLLVTIVVESKTSRQMAR